VKSSSTEADEPSLLAGKKASTASGKSVERVGTTERLNPDTTTIVRTILSPSHVAEATVSGDEYEEPTDEGYHGNDFDRDHMRELGVEKAKLLRRQKQATKEVKAANRKIRDAQRMQTSLAQTQDMGTPQAAGSRSTVQTTCVVGLMPGADGQAAAETVLSNPGRADGRGQRKRNPVLAEAQLGSLQEESRKRILPPADHGAEPASGRSAAQLAQLFRTPANFPAQPAGGVPKFLSPTAAAAPEKTPKRPRSTPSKPDAEHEQAARKASTLQEVFDGYGPAPFRVADAAKAVLAVVRHNASDQRARQQSLGDGAAAAKGGQAQRHQSGRRSPHPEAGATTQSASDKNAAARPPIAASTSFARIHAAVGQLNAHRQATTVDGMSSISDVSSDNRPQEINFQPAGT
jgi:hypothetical protein